MTHLHLKPDSIIEALFEVRFTSDEIPEILVGKLAALQPWQNFAASQLPMAQMPLAFRRADPNLAFMPTLERKSADGKKVVRIGERVLSVHQKAPYPSWQVFGPEIKATLDLLHGLNLRNFKVNRLALRYTNAFTKKDHGIDGISDLNLNIAIDKNALADPYVLMFRRQAQKDIEVDIRLAAAELVANREPADLTCLADLDFHTPDKFDCVDLDAAKDWTERAHVDLDALFLSLLSETTKQRLVVN